MFFYNSTDNPSIINKLNIWSFLNLKSFKIKMQNYIIFYINSFNGFYLKNLKIFFKSFSFEFFFFKISLILIIFTFFFLVSMFFYNFNKFINSSGYYYFIFYYFKSWTTFIFFYFLFYFIFIICLSFLSSIKKFNLINNFIYLKKFINFFLFIQIIFFFFFFCLNFFFFLTYSYLSFNFVLLEEFVFCPKFINAIKINFFYFRIVFDFFGFCLVFLAYIIGLIAVYTLDTRINWRNFKYLSFFNIFIFVVYLYVSVSNLVFFFFCYEALLLPSFLFVFFISPSKRAVQAAIYFVIWTQIGSILVLIVFCYFLFKLNVVDFFSLKNINLTPNEALFLYLFLFLGFGFKVPIWPFHYWITKTHVEAPSGFSIYLSGFLVKTALFGFYKITVSLNFSLDNTVFLIFCFFSIFDASLKMWGQTDLKKLAAYATIQEMNMIYLMLIFAESQFIFFSIIFVITHAFLSAYMFFLVDCVYKRFSSRSIIAVSGILNLCPFLGIFTIIKIIFFSALPGTIKFNVEFCLFSGLLEYSIFSTFFVMFVSNVLGLIGYSKVWFNSLFGLNEKKKSYNVLDLSFKEIFLCFFFIFFLFFFSFLVNFFNY